MNQLAGLVSEYGLYGASLLAFVAIVVWTFRPSAKKRYQADGSIPFNEEEKSSKTL
jgi:cbb3-type cytochrome oxidase subunit 3